MRNLNEEGTFARQSKEKQVFLLLCPRLIVLWLTPKIGGTSTIKIKPFLFCIVFGLHELFISQAASRNKKQMNLFCSSLDLH